MGGGGGGLHPTCTARHAVLFDLTHLSSVFLNQNIFLDPFKQVKSN